MGKVFKNGLSKMWKTVFKKVEVIWPAETDHITSSFSKTVFHKFYLVHWPKYSVANAISSINVIQCNSHAVPARLNLNKSNHLQYNTCFSCFMVPQYFSTQYFCVVFYSAYDPGVHNTDISCSKSSITTPEKLWLCCPFVFKVNFEHVSWIFLLFLLLILRMCQFPGKQFAKCFGELN